MSEARDCAKVILDIEIGDKKKAPIYIKASGFTMVSWNEGVDEEEIDDCLNTKAKELLTLAENNILSLCRYIPNYSFCFSL